MACKQCEKCKLFREDIEPCPGQGIFDPRQCPVEKAAGKVIRPRRRKAVV